MTTQNNIIETHEKIKKILDHHALDWDRIKIVFEQTPQSLWHVMAATPYRNNNVPIVIGSSIDLYNLPQKVFFYLYPITTQKLLRALPHGAGIDAAWHFRSENDYIYASNSFHYMNDTGFYICWIDFEIKIDPNDPLESFELIYNEDTMPEDFDDEGLFKYLDDTIYSSLDSWTNNQLKVIYDEA